MKTEEESYQLTIADEQNKGNSLTKKIQHIYLEQENIYGRFVPYLLLKQQLQSQIDSSGNTALHHMCSHNSPYIPLFLSCIQNGDPILNRKSKMGHTPLDVAGLYCSREYVEMLKEKGAVDNGNVDYWAIHGANPANWSGKIDPNKKGLIHWAAYNDMPQVISEYAKAGVNISEPDSNNYTPIDLAVINKSYNSMKLLAELGERPKVQLVKTLDSISMKQYLENLNEGKNIKILKQISKISSLFLILGFCLLLSFDQVTIGLTSISLFLASYVIIKPYKAQRYMDHNRKTEFISELLWGKSVNRRNHIAYLLMHIFVISCGLYSLIHVNITNHIIALLVIIVFVAVVVYFIHLLVQVYGICRNLTYDELFNSHKWHHLWDKIKFIEQRKMVIKQFSNPEDRGIWQNLKDYFCQ